MTNKFTLAFTNSNSFKMLRDNAHLTLAQATQLGWLDWVMCWETKVERIEGLNIRIVKHMV